jgi:hypothetical protein
MIPETVGLGTARSSSLREQRAAFKTSHRANQESREKLLTNPYHRAKRLSVVVVFRMIEWGGCTRRNGEPD